MPFNYPRILKTLPFLLIIISAALIYSNTLQVPFVFDDINNIADNKAVKISNLSFKTIEKAATQSFASRRWLPNISFALNHYINGLEVRGFHLVNIAIHIINGILLYILFLTTLKLPGLAEKYSSNRHEIALLATLLWLAHPLQTNAVTYIVQRMTSLATLFYISSLLFFVQGCLLKKLKKRGQTLKTILWFGAAALAAFCAFFSKENAAMLLFMIPAYGFFFLPTHSFSRKAFYQVGGAALIAMILATLIFSGNDLTNLFKDGYELRDFTLAERLLTESRVIFFYISLLMLPLPSRLNLNHDFTISQGLMLPPQTFVAILGVLTLIGLIPFLFKRDRLLSFAIFWFLGNLIIESTIIPLELVFEHRLYLPSIFLSLSFVAFVCRFFQNHRNYLRVAFLLIIPALMVMTFQRNLTWASKVSLWSDVVEKSPQLARGYGNLGKALKEEGDYDKAEKMLLKAYALDPENGIICSFLGELYAKQNRLNEAVTLFQLALSKDVVDRFKVCCALGSIHKKNKNYADAILSYLIALKIEPDNLETIVNLGISYEAVGRPKKALEVFTKAYDKGLESVDLYNNWGISAFSLGLVDEAISHLQKAIRLDPQHPESHYNLGIAYGSKGFSAEARREMTLAMRLREKSD